MVVVTAAGSVGVVVSDICTEHGLVMPKLSQAMLRLGDDSLKEMLKIEGFQIRTDTSMNIMGNDMKSWQEVQEITKKTAPAGTYGPPEGYTKKDKLDMTDIQR